MGIYADGHEKDKPTYEANKAEYYVNVFKDGKDMDDLMKWSAKWAKWASEGEPGEVFKNYNSAILVPYYGIVLIHLMSFGSEVALALKSIM